jgi:forespore regulator of the sigma-K checkpoint
MYVIKFLKQLKKRLRWRRRWIALGIFLLLLAMGLAAVRHEASLSLSSMVTGRPIHSVYAPVSNAVDPENQTKAQEAIRALKGRRAIFLQTLYVCGEETQQLGLWSSKEVLEAQQKHPNWLIRINETDKVTFIERIEDLSPVCKERAHFGMDAGGNLSLFNGVPGRDNVIRTFFQLDILYLKSSLPQETVKELYQGIRVSDMAEYNSILSTFSDYAVEDTDQTSSS